METPEAMIGTRVARKGGAKMVIVVTAMAKRAVITNSVPVTARRSRLSPFRISLAIAC